MPGGLLSVLGIDAAWTARQPSGVALVVNRSSRWEISAVASSYADFLGARQGLPISDPSALLARAAELAGRPVTLVAADIPLSHSAIVGRRASDDAVSVAYGARYASTHTPNVLRPGPISEELRSGFHSQGYPLRTHGLVHDGLIEVYPHPALIELSGAPVRLPYKQGKIRRYWPDLPVPDRRLRLIEQWGSIVSLLDAEIGGVAAALILPEPAAPAKMLKAFEDSLDAVVCAWVGICALEGRAVAMGDEDSAIWIPLPLQR
ncbi:MAG TPA: DUF429 domain-containing protein [Devosia sp.]|jgi:predicted RNase H-like nuclease|uniref:DUF429 domain-containing protein n=1 Tax=Devosia sp. TaxID=1871048 RepID=UPI002DDD18F5|nr:DUF429 domain-containing protein [Devosia sp.]HEV2515150.1 DUF429 domain-containing protein [Devosia sp.]